MHWSALKVKVTCKLVVTRTAKPRPIEKKITNSMAAADIKIKVGHKGMSPETPRCLLAKCVRLSRPFLNRMLDLLRKSDKLSKIFLTMDFKRDLNWFLEFIPKFNGKAFISHQPTTEEIELDASLQGLEAGWGNQVYSIPIPLGYENMSIVHFEMRNILVAIRVWGPHWNGKSIRISCDNQAVVMVLNSGKTRDLTLAAIARNIFMEAAHYDIFLKTVHIMGVLTEIADSLSRCTISEHFRQKFYQLLPQHVWIQTTNDVLIINWSI